MTNRLFLAVLLNLLCGLVCADDDLTITTWNIERLGTQGRGVTSGFGRGSLPLRSKEELQDIAVLITNTLKSDVIALQEIGITHRRLGVSFSKQLNTIRDELKKLGKSWSYYLPPVDVTPAANDRKNIFPAFLWNRKRVRLRNVFAMNMENQVLAGKALFDRRPLVGYFEAIDADGKGTNDFVLVNVHMASGQDYDENHLIAMTLIEYELPRELGRHAIREQDRIILGDFNDNPYAVDKNGKRLYSSALYEHMKSKGYKNLVHAESKTTRASVNLNSLIDHILVNESVAKDIPSDRAAVYRPDNGTGNPQTLAAWRRTFSDHFPVSFKIVIRGRDDDSDFFD
ncbi:MAG: endonuclease/exonuclease/phosphatase family protein [Planctomycetes bacterium]|nr:endonuclease/exonuclease/phosphatase family protein [Planctomycetota bacterium]